ncbi:MAG: PDZ domain-containing protein [Acidobacteriota bacterium]
MRRTVSASLLCLLITSVPAVLGQRRERKGSLDQEEARAARSVVKVYLKREWAVLPASRLLKRPKVKEVVEFNGVTIDSQGHILSFVGGYHPELEVPGVRLTVRTLEGEESEAYPVGVDERISLAVLSTKLRPNSTVGFSADSAPKHFNLVSTGEQDWVVATPCLLKRDPKPWLPMAELQVSRLDLNSEECALDGSILLHPNGSLIGILTRAEPHRFSKKIWVFQVIPSRVVENSVRRILKEKRNLAAGWLGVYLKDADRKALITRVVPESPAEKAGLRTGDLILEWDGHGFANLQELVQTIRWKAPGSSGSVKVEREGSLRDFKVVLSRRQSRQQLSWAADFQMVWAKKKLPRKRIPLDQSTYPPLIQLGFVVSVRALPAGQLTVSVPAGLLVKKILAGSSAHKAGFRVGDRLVGINGLDLLTLPDLRHLEAAGKEFLEIEFVRDGEIRSGRVILP